jgi:hypothetical protein
MAVLAGIDLLAKFCEGSDNSGGKDKHGVGKRFKKFARKYMRLTKEEANLIYQLRNSLLHSFGLYTEEKDKKWRVKARYYFQLCQGSHELIAPNIKIFIALMSIACVLDSIVQLQNTCRI